MGKEAFLQQCNFETAKAPCPIAQGEKRCERTLECINVHKDGDMPLATLRETHPEWTPYQILNYCGDLKRRNPVVTHPIRFLSDRLEKLPSLHADTLRERYSLKPQ